MTLKPHHCCDTIQLSPGEEIFTGSDYVIKVKSGALAEHIVDEADVSAILFFWLEGDYILPPVDSNMSHVMKSLGACEISLIKKQYLPGNLLEQQRLSNQIYTQQHMFALLNQESTERLNWFLRAMTKKTGGSSLYLPMSRKEIGSHLGLTFETVSRSFSKLKAMRLIEVKDSRNLTIRDDYQPSV